MMKSTPLAFSLLGALLLTSPARALAPVTITFDLTSAGLPLSAPGAFADTQALRDEFQSQGLRVRGAAPLDGPAILNRLGNFGVQPRSGVNFLAFNFNANLANTGRPRDPVDFLFDGGVSSFAVFASGGNTLDPLVLDAFDSDGASLGTQSVDAPAGAYALLSFSSPNPIHRVRIDATVGAPVFVLDDLSFTPVPEPLSAAPLVGVAALVRRRRRTV